MYVIFLFLSLNIFNPEISFSDDEFSMYFLARIANFKSYHLTLGFGSPTSRHSKVMVLPSSDCLITGRSVKVGLIPSSGTGASSPMFDTNDRHVENCSYIFLLAYSNLSLRLINVKFARHYATKREFIFIFILFFFNFLKITYRLNGLFALKKNKK